MMKSFHFLMPLVAALVLALAACGTDNPSSSDPGHTAMGASEYERGPHNGRMLREGRYALELTIFEQGVDPEFRLYAYRDNAPIDPQTVNASITLSRLGGRDDEFTFRPVQDYLRGDGVVTEPHSFEVHVRADFGDTVGEWSFESFEGRTTISRAQADAAGVVVEPAGPARLEQTTSVYGVIELRPEAYAEIRGWLPGRIVSLNATIGDRVTQGQTLARITATDSLQTYSVTSPINGIVMARPATNGGPTGDGPLFEIADPTQLHAELFLYPGDMSRIAAGHPVTLTSVDGQRTFEGEIEFISPAVDPVSQRAIAHVHLDNPDGVWRAGEAVEAAIVTGVAEVPLAVRTDALQRFRDFTVVYARVGDTYEVRMLELGLRTPEMTEVLGGLEPGEAYVSQNAFLITADVLKSGASHDH